MANKVGAWRSAVWAEGGRWGDPPGGGGGRVGVAGGLAAGGAGCRARVRGADSGAVDEKSGGRVSG